MKERYCINIDKCIVLPMMAPIGWSVFLLGMFLVTFSISLAKEETSLFFESLVNGWGIWFYVSGPISLVISALISVALIVFPISYAEVGDESIRIHRAFKKDRVLRYDEIHYVRLNKKYKSEWAYLFVVLAGGEINTIEIFKDYPLPSIWFSSSRRAYYAITKKLISACSENIELVEGDYFVAQSQWFAEHENPQKKEWGGHYGRY